MNPRLMRPLAAGNRLPVFATAGYTRLWAVTTQSGGDITGSAETDAGYYAVKWWDNTVDIYDSGDPFSKSAAGNQRAFEVYPCDIAGVPGGQFDGFDLSDNSLTQVRSEGVTLASSGGALTGGFAPYGYWLWGPYFSPVIAENGIISDNLLSAEALDQFYTDLDNGTGSLFVDGNPGIDADDPTIATAKGYTVFGSVPPVTSLLLNFNNTLADSSPQGVALTASGTSFDATEKKYGSHSLSLGSGHLYSGGYSDVPDLSGSDWTLEAWVWRPTGVGNATILNLSRQAGAPFGLHFWIGGDNQVRWDEGSKACATGGSVPVEQWAHIAAVRSGGSVTVYVDGASVATSLEPPQSGPYKVWVGAYDAGFPLFTSNMLIDDLRVVSDGAVYTANFTPPTSELEVYP